MKGEDEPSVALAKEGGLWRIEPDFNLDTAAGRSSFRITNKPNVTTVALPSFL